MSCSVYSNYFGKEIVSISLYNKNSNLSFIFPDNCKLNNIIQVYLKLGTLWNEQSSGWWVGSPISLSSEQFTLSSVDITTLLLNYSSFESGSYLYSNAKTNLLANTSGFMPSEGSTKWGTNANRAEFIVKYANNILNITLPTIFTFIQTYFENNKKTEQEKEYTSLKLVYSSTPYLSLTYVV